MPEVHATAGKLGRPKEDRRLPSRLPTRRVLADNDPVLGLTAAVGQVTEPRARLVVLPARAALEQHRQPNRAFHRVVQAMPIDWSVQDPPAQDQRHKGEGDRRRNNDPAPSPDSANHHEADPAERRSASERCTFMSIAIATARGTGEMSVWAPVPKSIEIVRKSWGRLVLGGTATADTRSPWRSEQSALSRRVLVSLQIALHTRRVAGSKPAEPVVLEPAERPKCRPVGRRPGRSPCSSQARTSVPGRTSPRFETPAMARVMSSSARSVRSMCRTPASPPSARPCTYGRPMTTASAPRPSAR